jgi:hypothetical protein
LGAAREVVRGWVSFPRVALSALFYRLVFAAEQALAPRRIFAELDL